MTWFFSEESTPVSERALDALASQAALVPALWYLEVTNVLAAAERAKRTSQVSVAAFLRKIRVFEIETERSDPSLAFTQLMPLCRTYKLTSYDAAYLELALRTDLPLVTLDKDLRRAAKKAGASVW
jgi:predicted nucleic acid-binding protein